MKRKAEQKAGWLCVDFKKQALPTSQAFRLSIFNIDFFFCSFEQSQDLRQASRLLQK